MIKAIGIQKAIDNLRTEFDKKNKVHIVNAKRNLLTALQEATPVDTGNARDSWEITDKGIVNTAPYITSLNEGSSAQAPVHFIEKTVLAQPNIVPNGQIVRYD